MARWHLVFSPAILLVCCACSFAADPLVGVTQYAATAGLFRFDGAILPGHREGRADSTLHFQNTHAQGGQAPGSLKVTHLTSDDGLSHNRIYSILQDRRGFMWFATEDGIDRYDGNTFVVYQNNRDDPNTLSGNLIQSLIEDRDGYLWIGTWGGLDKFDPSTERFTHYRHNPDNPNSISGNAIKSIAQDSRGYIWAGTVDEGLNKLDPATDTFIRYHNDSHGELVGTVNSIIEDSRRDIWFVGTRGLFHLSPQTGQITRPPTTIDRLAADYIHEDKAGNLWMLAYAPVARLVKYDRQAERFTEFSFGEGAVGVPNSTILDDGPNGLWVASSQGLHHFDLQTEQFTYRFQHDGTNPDSLNDNNVSSIYRDKSGMLWVGTENGGLNILDFRRGQFGSYQHRPGNPGSLSPGVVTALHQDNNGVLWVGFTLFALDRLDRKTGQITHYLPGSGNKNALGKGSSLRNNIYRDARGYLWFGGWDSGLNRFDERSGQFKNYRHEPDDPNSLLSDNILCIYQDRSGRLWVGQVDGLSSFDPTTETFINYRGDPAHPAGLGIGNVSAIYQDRSGTLWFGTWMGTLSRFDEKTNTFVNLRADPRDPRKLSGGRIHAIHEDQAGALWLGTLDGLSRYDRENDTFTHYTVNQGLPSGGIQCILGDRSGRLWLGTNKGISQFDPHTGRFRNYDTYDGLHNNDFSEGCYQNADGEMLFGGNTGITTFFPENIRDNTYVPPVVLTSFRIFNKPVPIGPESALKKAIPYADSLTLSYRDSVFSFEFAALSYANSHKNRYRYKLDHLEPAWNELGSTQRLATYTNLNPGKYVFRVQGSNSDGVWNEEGVSLAILITPPWWRTNSFRVLFAIVLLTAIWAAYQLRLRQLAVQFNLRLEERVSERTRIARELHDTLLQSFHGALLGFQTVSYLWAERPELAKEKLDSAINEAARAITEGRNAVQGLRGSTVGTSDLADAIDTLGAELAAAGGDRPAPAFQVTVEGEPRPLHPILRDEIYKIAAEALRNAFRHAEATDVDVEIRYDRQQFRLRVQDNGKGFAEALLPRQAAAGHYGVPGMRERAMLIGGTLTVWSKEDAGTAVELRIPARSAYVTTRERRWFSRTFTGSSDS